MSQRVLSVALCLCAAALASCAREDGASSNELIAQTTAPAASAKEPQPGPYDAQQARLEWLARPDEPTDALGPAGGD